MPSRVPIHREKATMVLVGWGLTEEKNDDLEKTDWMKDKETISGAQK